VLLGALVWACSPSVSPSLAPSATPSPSATPGLSSSSAAPTPISSAEVAAIYREINAQVEALRGLDEREAVEAKIVSPDEMAVIIERTVREDTPPDLLAAYERLYHVMGLLPEDAKLADVFVELLQSQVAGLYDPATASLYVVSRGGGGVGPLERVFYAHEYVHALQDQHFDLRAFQPADLNDQTDRQMARQALVEGDAYTGMTQWLQTNLGPFELLEFLTASQDPEALAALERIPPIVASQIVFAATQGFLWVLGIQADGGWAAVDAAFREPPDSTEQVLHPDKWLSREPPIEVDLPADLATTLGSGWSVGLEDTLGEAQIAVWLTDTVGTGGLPPPPPAGAVGWGGDRLVLLDGPADARAVVVKTEWDSAADAAEFETAVGPMLDDAPGVAQVLSGQGGTVRWVVFGSDAATLGAVAAALGLAG